MEKRPIKITFTHGAERDEKKRHTGGTSATSARPVYNKTVPTPAPVVAPSVPRAQSAPATPPFLESLRTAKTLSSFLSIFSTLSYQERATKYPVIQKALPPLYKLNALIGMDKVKADIMLQLLYYAGGYDDKNKDFLHTVIYGAPGTGKCLHPDTVLPLYNGTKKLAKELQPGDVLINDRGKPAEIFTTCEGYDKLYTITQTLGIKYTVNSSHILTLYDDIKSDIVDIPIRTLLATPDYTSRFFGLRSYHESAEYSLIPLQSIHPTDRSDNLYCGFECDGGRFLLEDGTVTHNTSLATILAELYSSMNIMVPSSPPETPIVDLDMYSMPKRTTISLCGAPHTPFAPVVPRAQSAPIFKIAHREDLIGGYLGQTALKTKALLKSCIGGTLFIDEVYALGNESESKDIYSKECIDTINAFLSDHKNEFALIIAGYKDEINKCFFSVNSGLRRRFPWVYEIEPYTPSNLTDIFLAQLIKEENNKWYVSVPRDTLVQFFETYKKDFSFYAGDTEVLLAKAKLYHAQRTFGDTKEKRLLNMDDLLLSLNRLRDTKKDQCPDNKKIDLMYS